MQILHERNVKAPFVVPERVFHISRVCELHGMRLGRLILAEESEAKELQERNSPYIAFYHMGSRAKFSQGVFRVYVSGWEFDSPCREITDKEYIIALSDHSDFDGLMEYARRSKPKLAITDNFRIGYAETLAKEIHKRFGIPAIALPKR